MIEFTEAIERRLKILNEVIENQQKEIDKYSKYTEYYLLPYQIEIARAQAGIDNLRHILDDVLKQNI